MRLGTKGGWLLTVRLLAIAGVCLALVEANNQYNPLVAEISR